MDNQETKCKNFIQTDYEKINQIKANLHLANAQNLNNSSIGYITLGSLIFYPIGIFISPLAFVGTVLCILEASGLIEQSEKLIKEAIKLTEPPVKEDIKK